MGLKSAFTPRLIPAIAAILALALPVAPAMAQSTTLISIDAPADGANVSNGTQIDIGGWAVDTAGPGTGVDMVRIYLDNRMDNNGTLLGNANYGGARADVAAALGNTAYTDSGFDYLWTPSGVSGGSHTIYVYAHSIANGWAYKTVAINVQGPTAAPARTGGGGPAYGGQYGAGGPMTPYGGSYLNTNYGYPGYGGYGGYGGGYGCAPYYDYYSPVCTGYGAYAPPPPYYGGGIPPYGGYGAGIGYQQTVVVVAPPSGTVLLSWIANPSAQSYRIYQATAAQPANFTVAITVPQTSGILATNGTVTGLTPGQTYYLQVRAVDPNGLE